jgi:hypothetical protein
MAEVVIQISQSLRFLPPPLEPLPPLWLPPHLE